MSLIARIASLSHRDRITTVGLTITGIWLFLVALFWLLSPGDPDSGEGFFSDPDMNHFKMAPRDIPSYPIESEPGDAVFFSHQMWHSSFGGKVGRRMFTLNFRSAQPNDGKGK